MSSFLTLTETLLLVDPLILSRVFFSLTHSHTGVDLSVIVTFNRMKSLTTNFKVICDALRKSTSGVVEVNDVCMRLCVIHMIISF